MLQEPTRYWKRNGAMMVLSQILVMSGFCAAMPFIPLFLKEGLGILDTGERGLYLSMFNFYGMPATGRPGLQIGPMRIILPALGAGRPSSSVKFKGETVS